MPAQTKEEKIGEFTYSLTQLTGTTLAAGLARFQRESAKLGKEGLDARELFTLYDESALEFFANLFGKVSVAKDEKGRPILLNSAEARDAHFTADRLKDFFGWLIISFMWNYQSFFESLSQGSQGKAEKPSDSIPQ